MKIIASLFTAIAAVSLAGQAWAIPMLTVPQPQSSRVIEVGTLDPNATHGGMVSDTLSALSIRGINAPNKLLDFRLDSRFRRAEPGKPHGAQQQQQQRGVSDIILAVVPEPGTWAMMMLGIWGIGGMLRYRRTRPVARADAD